MTTPKKPSKKPTKSWALIKKLIIKYLSPYKSKVFLSMLMMAITAAITALLANMMQPIVNTIANPNNIDSSVYDVIPLAGALLIMFFIKGITGYGQAVTMNSVGQSIVADIQNKLSRHLLHADLSTIHNKASGEFVSILVNDVNLMRLAISETVTAIGRNLLMLIFLVGTMFYQDWRLALMTFIAFPLLAIFVALLSKTLRKVSGNTQEEWAQLSAKINESLQSARLVKAYRLEDVISNKMDKIISRLKHLIHRGFRYSNMSRPMGETLTGVAIAGVLVYAGYAILGTGNGEATGGNNDAGSIMAFITAFIMAYEPMKRLGKLNGFMQMGLAAAERVQEILDIEPTIIDTPNAKDIKINGGNISLENCSFDYGNGKKVLDNITMDIPSGKQIALVGPSGAGKSTILNLIPRFYELTSGNIKIDGQNIKDITLASLRDSIAIVSQEVAIFDDTVSANIGFGRMDASLDEIKTAAKNAAADEFIQKLPNGYETRLGENGVSLSGGQRQRIAIARAMLRDAPILLLDEATSALDTQSERLVQKALTKLQKGRTSLIIAHRLSTIKDADLIYVMQDGKIIEKGNHEELITQNGLYKKLNALQNTEI